MEVVKKVITKSTDSLEKLVSDSSSSLVKNQQIVFFLSIITTMTVICSYNELSSEIKSILCHPFTKMFVLYINMFMITKNVKSSLMITLVTYLIYFIFVNLRENFDLLKTTPEIHPGCKDITAKDIIDKIGGGDIEKTKKILNNMNIPYGVTLDDLNAPSIATYLVNQKTDLSGSCVAL